MLERSWHVATSWFTMCHLSVAFVLHRPTEYGVPTVTVHVPKAAAEGKSIPAIGLALVGGSDSPFPQLGVCVAEVLQNG